MKMKRLPVFVEKAKDLGEGVIEAVIASEKKDRHGERLSIKGIDLSSYKQNPVVLWAHKQDEPPIGRTLSITKQADKLVAKIQFAINEDDFAHKIYKLYKGGFMRAFSIGFIPKDMDGDMFTQSEMIEHSAVPIPANDEALALAVSKGVISNSDIKKIGFRAEERSIMTLKDILAKKPEDLTAEERAFLIENQEELSEAQKAVFANILPKSEEANEADEDEGEVVDVKSLNEKLEKLEKSLESVVIRKDINTTSASYRADEARKKLTKEDKTKLWFKGLVNKNFTEYVDVVGKDATTMDTSDTDAVLPPEEFIAEVSRLEEEYGVAARYANVRRTSNNSLRGVKGGDDLSFVKTDELGLKSKQKATYDKYELSHLEYTGLVPVSDTLLEDSAINIWNDLTGRFARASAKREDELVFTENDTDDDVYGILEATGTNQISVGADFAAFDGTDGADKLNEMIYGVPTPSMSNGRFYLHRTVLGRIQRMKNEDGQYIWQPGINGDASGTIWGMPYTLTEVLPAVSEIEDNDPFMIFGDLSNTTLSIRVPMETKFFDTGVITDSNGDVLLNLMQQDAQVIRARLRMNQVHVHPEAYSVLVAGSLS